MTGIITPEDYMKLRGQDGHLHPVARKMAFVSWWKKDKGSEMVELSHLGIWSDPHHMQGAMEERCAALPDFKRRFQGGRFYAVDIKNTYPPPGVVLLP